MKIDTSYRIREIAGETIVVNQGVTETNLTRIISLNASARLLWEKLSDRDFEIEDAASVLSDRYGIDQKQAIQDATTWIEALKKCNIIVE